MDVMFNIWMQEFLLLKHFKSGHSFCCTAQVAKHSNKMLKMVMIITDIDNNKNMTTMMMRWWWWWIFQRFKLSWKIKINGQQLTTDRIWNHDQRPDTSQILELFAIDSKLL